jgi:hypothetical protein
MTYVAPCSAMKASMRCNSGRSADLADSPASMNSAMTVASSASAFRLHASLCAGIEKPSAYPPRSAWSFVLTRK